MSSYNPTLSDVLARRAEIKRMIDTLQAEDGELEIAARVLSRLTAPQGAAAPTPHQLISELTLTGKETTEEVLTLLLSGNQLWWTANQLQEAASALLGREVPMTTVSPTLSLMKGKGVISRDGLKVALAARVSGLTEETLKGTGIIPHHATLIKPSDAGSSGSGVLG